MRDEDFAAMIAGLERHGISKKEIAYRTGISYATVWRMANGGCKHHYSDTVDRVEILTRKTFTAAREK